MRSSWGAVALGVLMLGGASPCGAGDGGVEKKAMQVLDDFMKAFNASDRKKQSDTFHFPHVRIAGDKVKLYRNAEEFEKDGELEKGLERQKWHHSKWDSRKVIQHSDRKAHVAVTFTRYDRDGKKLATYDSIYIVTKKGDRWGIQARSSFAP